MPKRDGMGVVLHPSGLYDDIEAGYLNTHEWWLYGAFQLLNKHNDIERDGLAVFIVGPKEWQKFMPITKKSVQTMKRWLKTLEGRGWVTVERISKDTHRVTIFSVPVEKRNYNAITKSKSSLSDQGHPPQQ